VKLIRVFVVNLIADLGPKEVFLDIDLSFFLKTK